MTLKAVISGVSGQDGSFLADMLVQKGYEVHGIMRRYSSPNLSNIKHLISKDAIHLVEADLTDSRSLTHILEQTKPDEFYNLGAMSHVGTSYTQPETTLQVTGLGALRVYEACRQVSPRTRVYQASSSEQFGNVPPKGADRRLAEEDEFQPVSPYGCAKVLAHQLGQIYRTSYGLHISMGILFNHESEHRGTNFVTRKITLALARMKCGLQDTLQLGNLDAVRDWGYAPEYVDAMWRMLQQDEPGDFVIATGQGHTVRDFLAEAWRVAGLEGPWQSRVTVDSGQHRPMDIHRLVGNASLANVILGWEPATDFAGLTRIMMDHDMRIAEKEVQHART